MDSKYPWLVVQNLEAKDDKIFYPIHDPQSKYECRISGGRIRGCFNGWVVLSDNLMWSIWNPVTCKVIHLPPLDIDSESIEECCLSSPPDDPTSLLLLTIHEKPTIVFCRMGFRLEWAEISYDKELKSMELERDSFLYSLTCCNGEVYSLISGYNLVMRVDIHKEEVHVINLLPMVRLPYHFFNCFYSSIHFLKGTCGDQLFYILLSFDDEVALCGVHLYKLNMTSMKWEELQDLKDAVFFLDLAHDELVYYRPEIASELGGYIHILDENGEAMHSLRVKDKIASLSSMSSCLGSSNRLLLWECNSLPHDHGEIIKRRGYSKPIDGNGDIIMLDINSTKNEEDNESHLLNIPFNVLEMIMELCVGVEYLNFRATCKLCQLGAPIIRWNKGILHTPWLVVVNHHQGLITFTDPMFGDNYYIKTPPQLNGVMRILCCKHGWLLMMEMNPRRLVFFNPFTRDIRELPRVPVNMFCFSAPPTSPDCIVVGFAKSSEHVYIHFVAGEPYWRMLLVDANPLTLRFPTFHGRNLYALSKDGGLFVIREIDDIQDYSWRRVTPKAPTSQYFLVKGVEHFLLVKMGRFGEDIQLFKLNTKEWERIDSLGRHVIYICDTTCICIEAKTQEMGNKIYFPRLHSKNRKIVFYSLETRTYHTSDGKNMEQNFYGTQHHTYTHTWIQPKSEDFWVTCKSFGEHTVDTSSRLNNECKRVSIVREWIESSTQQGGTFKPLV